MRRLLELLRANLHWVLLVVCEAIALLLLFHGSLYHSFVGAAASSSVVGRIHTEGARWRSYLSLQQENQQLTAQLASLEGRYLALQRQFEYLLADTVVPQVMTFRLLRHHCAGGAQLYLCDSSGSQLDLSQGKQYDDHRSWCS